MAKAGSAALTLGRTAPSGVARDRPKLGSRPVGQVQEDLVEVAPAPAFGRIVAFYDRMTGRMEMLGRVPVGRRIAAPTWPQVLQSLRCTQGEPVFRHSSQPRALGVTSRIELACVQVGAMNVS